MIFPPFGNTFLSPSKNIILRGHLIIYPLKQKDIYDYNPLCLISSGLMFDDIIMNLIRNKALECPMEEVDSFFLIDNNRIYIYRGSLQEFY